MSGSVMGQIIDHFSNGPHSKWRIDQKRLWLEYLQTGKLPFTINELHNTIQEIVNKPANRPRGEKLLKFRKRTNFTLKDDKMPYRPEEALERFIIVSNDDNFFNQFPIGGGKESIDMVCRHSRDLLEFIELKPWNSGDSPLYGLVEGLKNLIEYRMIVEQQICDVEHPWKVDVSVLAPGKYYRNFMLFDDSGLSNEKNIFRITELINKFAGEFSTKISILSLRLSLESFTQMCARVYDHQGLVGQQVVTLSLKDGDNSLNKGNWVSLASSS